MSLEVCVLTYTKCVLKHVSWNYVVKSCWVCLENYNCVLRLCMCLDIWLCLEHLSCLLMSLSWNTKNVSWNLYLETTSWKVVESVLEVIIVSWNYVCVLTCACVLKILYVSWCTCLEIQKRVLKFVSWNYVVKSFRKCLENYTRVLKLCMCLDTHNTCLDIGTCLENLPCLWGTCLDTHTKCFLKDVSWNYVVTNCW